MRREHLSQLEQAAIWVLIRVVPQAIEADHSPDGYNIGVNIGVMAGQSVSHAHLHLMPRYHRVTFLMLAAQYRVRVWARQKRINTAGGWYFICAGPWRGGFRRGLWGGPVCPIRLAYRVSLDQLVHQAPREQPPGLRGIFHLRIWG